MSQQNVDFWQFCQDYVKNINMSLIKTSYQRAVEAVRALSPSERERLFACFNEKPVATKELDGIVEVDGTYFLESFTGNHASDDFKMPREPRKRGGKVSKRGISNEQGLLQFWSNFHERERKPDY